MKNLKESIEELRKTLMKANKAANELKKAVKDNKFKTILAKCDFVLSSKINKIVLNDEKDKLEQLLASKELTLEEKCRLITYARTIKK